MKIVVFGAGANAYGFLCCNPVSKVAEIVKVIDNDENKWGKSLVGLPQYVIDSPNSINEVEYDVVLVTPANGESIKTQLINELGVEKNRICGLGDLVVPAECNLGTVGIECDASNVYTIGELISGKIIPGNKMEEFYFEKPHNVMNKWWHYFEVYEDFFGKYVGSEVKMLEIGVFKGGSMQMWKSYFGEKAQIVGVDIDERCKAYEGENVHICIGSQADSQFLKEVSEKYGPFDIILDDGSHMMDHQIITFETLFPLLKNGGVFICEDCHTSYMKEYDGGYLKKDTFIEYSKSFVDAVNGQFFNKENKKSEIEDYIKACHYYDSMVVIEKKKRGYSVVTEFALD